MVEENLDEEITDGGFQQCGRLDDSSENIRICFVKNYSAEGDRAFCLDKVKSVRILSGKNKTN